MENYSFISAFSKIDRNQELSAEANKVVSMSKLACSTVSFIDELICLKSKLCAGKLC